MNKGLDNVDSLFNLNKRIAACSACPRLVAHRESIATVKVARYRDEEYWGRPVPSFGDPGARIMVLGLAPAAHGGNRTGRSFTGDPSGDWLFGALHRAGFANQPRSISLEDGLELTDVYIANGVRCAPPDNKPTPAEKITCRPFLVRELELLQHVKVVVVPGQVCLRHLPSNQVGGGPCQPQALAPFWPRSYLCLGRRRNPAKFLPSQPPEHSNGQINRGNVRQHFPAGERTAVADLWNL